MTADSLRALLDAAAKATPNPCPMAAWENFLDHASPDVVAALARIALAAVQWEHSATSITTWDQFEADERSLSDALHAAGLRTTAPQETKA